ncbi:MAG: TRAP transporter substrate-binding protein DctP [Verrucomicrobia bacterium]|jgi:TRAP-type C4-dicarboxylate transport system substrate-binding protein|nr:TRAP transporter substrate-binding protein DctP [Verrucomicrobiota bacterium]
MKMKQLTQLVSLVLLAAPLLTANRAACADPVKVRLATLAPKGSSYAKHLQAMGDLWRQAPGGGVALTIYPDGTMGSEADMVRRMRLGQLQAALVTTTGLTEIEPGVAGLQTMPKVYRNLEEVDYIGGKLQPMLEKRMEAKGFVVLFWSDTGFVRFFTKNPVLTPDDLRKTKLFVSANRAPELEAYRSVGVSPVPLEVADILPGLQTGLIDAVCVPPSFALAIQLDAAAPHMLDMNWAPLVGAFIINKKTWDAFSPAVQETLRKSAQDAGKLIKADGRRENVESVEALRKRGLKIHPLTPETDAEWIQTVEKAWPKIRGNVVPADIYDAVLSELKTFRAAKEGAAK